MTKAKHPVITYTGDQDQIQYQGFTFPRGKGVEVDNPEVVRILSANDFFDAEGVTEAPAPVVSVDEAVAAERTKHESEIASLQADHAKALADLNAEFQAAWDKRVAEHDKQVGDLNAELATAKETITALQKPAADAAAPKSGKKAANGGDAS